VALTRGFRSETADAQGWPVSWRPSEQDHPPDALVHSILLEKRLAIAQLNNSDSAQTIKNQSPD
jgi:hypothetical protein